MRTKMILFVIFTAATILCFTQTIEAQITVGEAISRMPTASIPFEGKKYGESAKFDRTYSYAIDNSGNAIPDRLYGNVQLTQYEHASISPDLCGTSFRKFAILNSNNVLLVVSFGGVTDWRTDVLCVVSPSGQILSTLDVAVFYHTSLGRITIKQLRINVQNQVIVTTIIPTSTTSIPFETFTSFTGYRKDITYSVNAQGQFVQVSEQTYPTKTYTRSSLESKSINLWEI
jgi:hypothetical protein